MPPKTAVFSSPAHNVPKGSLRRQQLTSSSRKRLSQFGPNLAGMFLGPLEKNVHRIRFHQNIWLPWQPNGFLAHLSTQCSE